MALRQAGRACWVACQRRCIAPIELPTGAAHYYRRRRVPHRHCNQPASYIAAFITAGGYGERIVTGGWRSMIAAYCSQAAIPAAVLAPCWSQILFEWLETVIENSWAAWGLSQNRLQLTAQNLSSVSQHKQVMKFNIKTSLVGFFFALIGRPLTQNKFAALSRHFMQHSHYLVLSDYATQ
jgi:hypothetical protein